MARYVGPVCRLCRREGMKLFLKGERCYTDKCAIEKRNVVPGQHGRARTKETEYLIRFREKQKAKRIYGVLEKQFRNTYDQATRMKGITGENLLSLLELRLDNVLMRAGFATSRDQSRQLVNHGHVLVNGRKLSIPAARLRVGDTVEVREKSRRMTPILHALAITENRSTPGWLRVERESWRATVGDVPTRADIDVPVQEQLIVELYSK